MDQSQIYRSLMGTIQKDSDNKKKTEINDLDQLVTNCCHFDSARYSLSAMKNNSQTGKNTQTIKDESNTFKTS
jgi:uncharacterized protein YutD